MAKQFTLGKNERLKSRKQIEELFRSGKSFYSFPFRISYHLNDLSASSTKVVQGLQFGAGAGTRNFKKAVDRNFIKRLIREAWRLQKSELEVLLKTAGKRMDVFFIYTAKELPEYNLVYEKTGVTIGKLKKIVNENSSVAS